MTAEHSAGYSTSISLLIFNSDKTNSKIVVRDIVIIDGDSDANRRRANGNGAGGDYRSGRSRRRASSQLVFRDGEEKAHGQTKGGRLFWALVLVFRG